MACLPRMVRMISQISNIFCQSWIVNCEIDLTLYIAVIPAVQSAKSKDSGFETTQAKGSQTSSTAGKSTSKETGQTNRVGLTFRSYCFDPKWAGEMSL